MGRVTVPRRPRRKLFPHPRQNTTIGPFSSGCHRSSRIRLNQTHPHIEDRIALLRDQDQPITPDTDTRRQDSV
jgi:hypothetical protein